MAAAVVAYYLAAGATSSGGTLAELEAFLRAYWPALAIVGSILGTSTVGIYKAGRVAERLDGTVNRLARALVAQARRSSRGQAVLARGVSRVSARTRRLERELVELRARVAPEVDAGDRDDGDDADVELDQVAAELDDDGALEELELELEAEGARRVARGGRR